METGRASRKPNGRALGHDFGAPGILVGWHPKTPPIARYLTVTYLAIGVERELASHQLDLSLAASAAAAVGEDRPLSILAM
jgi:hypothetical protein